jgi:hypothetical protein
VLDQAAGNTPDRMVGEFLGRAVDGRMAEADALTVEHDAARTLGPLNEVLGALRGARTEVVRHAAVAGTVAVGWHDAAGQGYEVRACAVRTPNAWRLAYFTSRSSCGTR